MELIWIFQTVSEGEFSEVGHTQRAKDHSFGGCSRPHLSAPCLHEMGYGLHARGCRSERRESFMSEENKTWARRAGEITSPDDLDLIEEVCAPDLVWHEPDQDVRGIEEGKRYVSDAPASPPLNTLAKTLADGTISRKQALKLMGAGAAAVASLALAGCGGKDQAKEGASDSGEPSGGSTSNTTVGQKGSTPKQGSAAEEVAAAAKRAMEKYHLKAVLVRVTKGTEEVATLVMGESMSGVPATLDKHFRNGAVAISYLGTVLLQLVDEGTVGLDDTIDEWLPKTLASEKVTLRMLI